MKKFFKAILTVVIYTGFIVIIQDSGEEVGRTVGELVADGIKEIPEEVSGIKTFIKKVILKERLFLKKVRDKVVGCHHPMTERDIVLDEKDEETLRDIEKEVSEL